MSLFDVMDVHVPDLFPAPDLNSFLSSSVCPSGVAYILSLPFPSLGCSNELSTVLPSELTCSVLGHVTHLIQCLSLVMHIPLLHPVQAFDTFDPVISAASDLTRSLPLTPQLGTVEPTGASDPLWPSIERAYRMHVQRANKKKSGAILNGRYVVGSIADRSKLTPHSLPTRVHDSSVTNRNFGKALNLLQANVIDFGLKLGLLSSQLFAPEYVLHNIYLIRLRLETLRLPTNAARSHEVALHRQMADDELMEQLLVGVSSADPHRTVDAFTVPFRSERAQRLEQSSLFSS